MPDTGGSAGSGAVDGAEPGAVDGAAQRGGGRGRLSDLQFPRRDFLTGALAVGTLSAIGTYFTPGGSAPANATINVASGDDPTGALAVLLGMWTQANPNITVNTIPVGGDSTLAQRDALESLAQSGQADLLNLDVINLPYFKQQNLISPIELQDVQQFLPSCLLTSQLGDPESTEYWAAPFAANVGMMFERLGSQPTPPGEVPQLSAVVDGLSPDRSGQLCGQLQIAASSSREAFVVNVLEQALSRDPNLLDSRTGMPSLAVERWQAALLPLRSALASGRITAVDNEADTRNAFRQQRLTYMRNWPVEYHNLQVDGDPDSLSSRVRVGPLPIAIRGGSSFAVTAKSRQAGRAADLARFLASVPAQRIQASYFTPATRGDAYVDAKLQTSIPHLKKIQEAVENARSRPITPYYPDFSDKISKHFSDFLAGADLTTSGFVEDIQNTLHLR